MRHISIATLLLLAGALTRAPSVPADEGFAPLFNGRDLSGWVNVNCAPDTFTVRRVDGADVIHCTGAPICALRTDRMYENFVLELEWVHLKAGGNAGVFVWADALPARGVPFLRAIEVQVLDGHETENYTSHGDVFAIHGARMTPDRPHPAGWPRSLPRERRARPAGEWNHYRITARDGTITLAVNGREVSGGYDIAPRKGYIALESEGSPVLFRNIRIRELPSAGALPPEMVARTDEGFVSLYNGQDLAGWTVPAGHAERWTPDDWTLKYDAGGAPGGSSLQGGEMFADVELLIDWRRTAAGGRTIVELRGPAGAPVVFPAGPPGEWNRSVLTLRGDRLSATLNGDTIVDGERRAGAIPRGPIVLRHDGPPIDVANVFVRRLEPPAPTPDDDF